MRPPSVIAALRRASPSASITIVEIVAPRARRSPSEGLGNRPRRSPGSRADPRGTRRQLSRWRRCTHTAQSRPAHRPRVRGRASGNVVEIRRLELERETRCEIELLEGGRRRGRDTSARTRSARACREARDGPAWLRRGTGRARERSRSDGSTTSMRSYGTPKSRCASISSRPLLASVAESTRDLRPHRPGRMVRVPLRRSRRPAPDGCGRETARRRL